MLLLSSYIQDHVVQSAFRYGLPGAVVPRHPKEETVDRRAAREACHPTRPPTCS
jgi:hypothetical protein